MQERQQGGMALVGLGVLGAPVLPSPPDTGPGTPEAAVAGRREAEAVWTPARNEEAVWAARARGHKGGRRPKLSAAQQRQAQSL